jgi:hypothetical protein
MKKKNTFPKIPVHDLNFSAFQLLHGNVPDLILQGTRVIFQFNADDIFHQLSERYNRNEAVKVLDFVNATRQLRAMMLSMRNGLRK